ncbi:hypothetical protein O181_037128 [Austropuccinia psidii MF-1]|uniref:Uncharacterized protein n=1 Tax=Austropuccinia psidii MF-1 TaxID=1389203 RepID=A0A9Q3DAT3_9BASI|nr:hypothetical protein [Austropuccinia psidii MF-1]
MSEGEILILGKVEDEGREESVEEEDSGETEVADALANAPEVPHCSNPAPTNQYLVSQSDPRLHKIIEQMATIMGYLSQAEAPKSQTPSMKAPDPFDGTQAHKLRGFIQSKKVWHSNFLSLVELANGLNTTFQIFPMKILPTASIIGSYLKPNYSLYLPKKIPLFILDSNESPSLFITHYTKWVVDFPSFPSFELDFFIIDSPKREDLIFGYDFLYHFNPVIDWKNGLITYYSSNKDSSGIKYSASNALATAVNSVALVGKLKTPSLPSSVHIHSIMPSQSLLKSGDEVFKEIKDVGEDFAIS